MTKLIIVALLAGFGLTACGVKGPLYFPEKTAEQPTQTV